MAVIQPVQDLLKNHRPEGGLVFSLRGRENNRIIAADVEI
jgi:hypothetical protein